MTEIGRMEKNKTSDIVVRTSNYKGRQLIDVREWVDSEDYKGPTKKGISIHKDRVSQLIALLELAKQAPDEQSENQENLNGKV